MNPETVPASEAGAGSSSQADSVVQTPIFTVPPEVVPNLDELVIEDNTPLDNIFMEKQERLLTEPLYSSWLGPPNGQKFQVFANVGLFFAPKQEPLAPDIMVVVAAQVGADLTRRENRSYFTWEIGKPPDAAIEMVSDRRGREEDFKFYQYAQIGVPYYVIFDPFERLRKGVLRAFMNQGGVYQPLAKAQFPVLGLGLMLWQGTFEGFSARWLRWCDLQEQVIPTGYERAEQERQRAEQANQRAEQERQRAEQERQKRELLEAQLRALGAEPQSRSDPQ